jgi:four helix bundle protein
MSGKGKFEDLEVWQEARLLANRIYDLSGSEAFSKDFGLRDQIRRAAVSVLSNIAEGYERDSDAEFGKFLAIAKGSAGEVRAQLYIARDRNYIGETDFSTAKEAAASLGRRIARFIAYLKRSSSANLSPRRTEKKLTTPSPAPMPEPHSSLSTEVWDF